MTQPNQPQLPLSATAGAAMSGQPYRIPGAKLREVYEGLGLDPEAFDRVVLISIDPRCIQVVMDRLDEQGRLVSAGDRVARETVDIAVDWHE